MFTFVNRTIGGFRKYGVSSIISLSQMYCRTDYHRLFVCIFYLSLNTRSICDCTLCRTTLGFIYAKIHTLIHASIHHCEQMDGLSK
jgi:hypothetical protein